MTQERLVVVDLRKDMQPGATGPLARVLGLPALVRTLLVLERRGYAAATLLTTADHRAGVEAVLASEPRLRIRCQVTVDEGKDQGLGRLLGEPAASDAAVLVWPGALTFGRLAPALFSAEPPEDGALVLEGVEGLSPEERPLLLHPDAVRRHQTDRLEDLHRHLSEENKLNGIKEELPGILLRGPDGVRRAEAALLQSLRKPVDGVVARYDRNVSLFISPFLMRLPVHPNWVTVAAVLLGVACGLAAARGGYLWMLIGALGFQLNSILDGVDGEIARSKLLESKLGQWLDTLADDVTNLFFTVGAAVGCYRTWGSDAYLVMAVVIAVGFIMSAILEYHYLITVVRSGDLNDFKMPWEEGAAESSSSGPMARLLARLKFIVKRDTFVFLSTVFALVGQLRVMVFFFALGASIVWVSILVYRVILPRLGRRQALS